MIAMDETPVISRLLSWTAQRSRGAISAPRRFSAMVDECGGFAERGRMRRVKVAGTNGKGSVCAMLEAGLCATGASVGMFTSPHIERMTERIRINGREIDFAVLESHAARVEPGLRDFVNRRGPEFVPTFFEVLLLIALRVFEEFGVEFAIIESGIGGTHDATSVLASEVSVVTTVSLDHQEKLGDTVECIAADKSGVASDGSQLVLGPGIDDSCAMVIRNRVADRGVEVIQSPPDATLRGADKRVDHSGWPAYQVENLATTVAVLDLLRQSRGLDAADLMRGIERFRLSGRFEVIDGDPPWLLDGAHNVAGITALREGVEEHFAARERVLIFGASREKSIDQYASLLQGFAREVHVTDEFHNARPAAEVAAALPAGARIHRGGGLGNLVRTLQHRTLPRDTLVVVTGSLFLVGRVRAACLGARAVANNQGQPNHRRLS